MTRLPATSFDLTGMVRSIALQAEQSVDVEKPVSSDRGSESTVAVVIGDEVATLRDALDHIVRVARNARVPTRRLDWIVSRGQRALDGKPFDMDAMPRYPKMQPAVPAVELGRCRTALCTAAELSLLLGNRPGQLDDVQATLDALRSQLRELGISA